MNFKRVFLANVEGQGDKSASQIIKKLVISSCLIAWCYGACAEPRKKCYPVPSEDCQEFDAPKVEDKFEKECEVPHVCPELLTVEEGDTMTTNYFTVALDKMC